MFRGAKSHDSAAAGDDAATISTINSGLNVMGLNELIGSTKAFINITEGLLLSGSCAALPPQRVVVELLENIKPTPEVIEAIRAVKDLGFTIALDDVVTSDGFEPLIELADIVKIDYMLSTPEQRRTLVKLLREKRVQILAEKVENHAEFNEALELGCHYFQGFFFCKPQTLSRKQITGSKFKYLHFIEQVNQPDIDFEGLESVIKADVSLSMKLLNYLNSAAFAFSRDINSIKHALVLLGQQPVKQWATTVALSGVSDDKPPALAIASLARARFCERTGPDAGISNRGLDLFLLGMLSLVDAMVDRPLADVVNQLPLNEEVKDALVGDGATSLAMILDLVIAYERCDWPAITQVSERIKLPPERTAGHYVEAIEWADQTMQAA